MQSLVTWTSKQFPALTPTRLDLGRWLDLSALADPCISGTKPSTGLKLSTTWTGQVLNGPIVLSATPWIWTAQAYSSHPHWQGLESKLNSALLACFTRALICATSDDQWTTEWIPSPNKMSLSSRFDPHQVYLDYSKNWLINATLPPWGMRLTGCR